MPAPEVDFLPFAAAAGANVISQSAYSTLGALSTGFSAGIASSDQLNKVWRQSSIMAAVIANLIADATGNTVIDDGTTATIIGNLALTLRGLALFGPDSGVVNAISVTLNPAITAYVDGLVVSTKPVATPTGATTLNVNGLGAKNVYGMNGSALQGGEYVANGNAFFIYNSSLNAGAGGFYLISTNGTFQVAPATQSNQAVNLGQFVTSTASPGYIKLPGGLIIQWINSINGTPGATWTFPIAFPNGFLFGLLSQNNSTPVSGYWGLTSGSKTSVNVTINGSNNSTQAVMVIGY